MAAVILAAGASTRLGSPKQMVRINHEYLLDRAIRIATESGCRPVIVVLGARAEELRARCGLAGVQVAINADWSRGIGTSVGVGIAAVGDEVEGAVVMACDQPAVQVAHLRELMAVREEVRASAYAGRQGVPAYFPRNRFVELLRLEGDSGARKLLRSALGIPLPGGELDVDTRETLEEARRLYERDPTKEGGD